MLSRPITIMRQAHLLRPRFRLASGVAAGTIAAAVFSAALLAHAQHTVPQGAATRGEAPRSLGVQALATLQGMFSDAQQDVSTAADMPQASRVALALDPRATRR